MSEPTDREATPIARDEVPIGTSSFPAIVRQAAERYADAPWMAFDGETQSFRELGQRSDAIAAALIAAGIGHDDGVASFMGNRFEWLQLEFGIATSGAWMVPLNTWFRMAELEHILDVSRARVLVWDARVLGQDMRPLLSSLLPELADARPGRWRSARFSELRLVVGIGDGPWPPGVTPWADFLAAGVAIGAAEVRARAAEVRPEQTGLVLFTSGTTGAPKGAVLTQTGIVDHLREWTRHIGLGCDDRSIMASPLFWTFGCTMNAIVPLLAGSMVVLEERFEGERFVTDIERYGCTHLQGVPEQYELALNHPRSGSRDLSTLRVVQLGGSRSAVDLATRICGRAPDVRLVAAYGLTEGVGVNTWTEFDDPVELLGTSIGHAAPDNEATVRDPVTFDELAAGEAGELWIRGAHVSRGYLAAPEATAESFEGDWLRTGDLVRVDDRGYFEIVGRRAHTYKRGGMNVYPAETELLLATHPAVARVAVVGVPDERLGEAGAAYVVLHEQATLTETELLGWATGRLARYKLPAHVRFVDTLPVTASGKVQKFALRDAFVAEQEPSGAAEATLGR
jgi:acyl-CoA synthetase (AMP-forming)/AMP-acid ligase II